MSEPLGDASTDAAAGELAFEYRLTDRVPLEGRASYRHVERWQIAVFLDRASGGWVDREARRAGPRSSVDHGGGDEPDTHVLLLDRIRLHPEHRGRGLGPIVAAAVIGRLGRGCHLAACYPAPFEETASQRPGDRERAVEALGRIWAKVGFRHWRDGVYMLDLRGHDITETLHDLLADRSHAAPDR